MQLIVNHIRFWLLSLTLGWACMGSPASSLDPEPGLLDASGTFSGRVWNDLNRNGLQEEGEPGMTNLPIVVGNDILLSGYILDPLAVYSTSNDGIYSFSFSYTQEFFVLMGSPRQFGISPVNVGTNDLVDSDLEYAGYSVTNVGFSATDKDLGLYYWDPNISINVQANSAPPGTPLHITNGSSVIFSYHVTNSGDVALSYIYVLDRFLNEIVSLLDCPSTLRPGKTMSASTQLVVYASMTNDIEVLGIPADPLSCKVLSGYDWVVITNQVVVIVDEWAEELVIQTLDSDGRLSFAEISNAVSYQVDWATNLMDTIWSTSSLPAVVEIQSIGPGARVVTADLSNVSGTFRVTAETNE